MSWGEAERAIANRAPSALTEGKKYSPGWKCF